VKQGKISPTLREIAQFSVSYLQVMDDEGKLISDYEPDLTRDDLLSLYRWMVLTRESDQRMLKLQRQGRIGTFGLGTGQEAATCASTFALGEKDWFVGGYREIGAHLVRGQSLANTYLYFNGYEEANVYPRPSRTLPVSIIVGAQALHAVGLAYAMKYKGEDARVMTHFGDGATSEGDVHEAMNFASVWQLPVVFFCQNNQWAISVPRSIQTRSLTIAQKAIAYGMPGIQVDGNDALAVYTATTEALARAKAGEGPTLIEAVTYRLLQHTTSDDPTRYRSEKEAEEWWKRDPIPRFRKYLETKGLWDVKKETAFLEDIRAEIEAAVSEFESMKGFKPDAPFDYVLGTTHAVIEEQRADFLDALKKDAADA
jgi:pyruvate dehydrogenase E1 component alpha subunit